MRRADEVGELTTRFNLLMHDRFVAEKARADSEERMRLLADNMPALVSYIDSNLRVAFANSAYKDWFGLDPEEMIGRRVDEIFDAAELRAHAAAPGHRAGGRSLDVRARGGHAEAERAPCAPPSSRSSATAARWWACTTCRRISRKTARCRPSSMRSRGAIRSRACYNRRSFEELLPQAVARCTRNDRWLALLFVDLDRFKAVNDTRGHDAGDDVLKAVAQRLIDGVRLTDTVARLGGDEFVVILEDLNAPGRCRDHRDEDHRRHRRAHRHARGRVARSAQHRHRRWATARTPTASDLLKRADAAHYAAKGAGRGRYPPGLAAE